MIKDRRQAVFPFLSEPERLVLSVLDGQAMRGIDIVQNSGGLLQRGSIDVILSGMEERGQSYFAPVDVDVQPLVWSWKDKDESVVYQGTHTGYYWLKQYWQHKAVA